VQSAMSSDDEMDAPSPVGSAPVLKDEGDICGDGSIMKEIITPGSGDRKPVKVDTPRFSGLFSGRRSRSALHRNTAGWHQIRLQVC